MSGPSTPSRPRSPPSPKTAAGRGTRTRRSWDSDSSPRSPGAARGAATVARSRRRASADLLASRIPRRSAEPTEGRGRNPYVFVVGCARSGTTLLQRMLDQHPQLAVINEARFIPLVIPNAVAGVDPPLTRQLVERVRSDRRFSRLGLSEAAVRKAAAEARTYSDFVTGLFSEYAALQGKPLAGDKTPRYVRYIRLLHHLFPWARFIHLIRDGRDVALSALEWAREDKGPGKFELWREEPVAVCALWWRRNVSNGRRDGADLDRARYREVSYEQLVSCPEEALRDLAAFLELPFAAQMLDYHQGKTRDDPRLSAKSAWGPPTPGLRDWRAQMDHRDLELFEAIAGDLLSALGYERAFDAISPEIAAVAARCRTWWETKAERQEVPAEAPVPGSRGPEGGRETRITFPRRAGETDPQTRTASSPNPYLFIVGCPRSGTTLLRRMVDAHPQIAITRETHWIPRYFEQRIGLTPEGLVTPLLIRELVEDRKFPNLRIGQEDLERLISAGDSVTYARFVSGIFDLYGRRKHKRFVGDKTPGYVQHIPLLHALWPGAAFVHLIRDGRDVCLSMLEWKRAPRTVGRFETWKEDPVSTTALWWERFVRLGREDGGAVGPGLYCELRYEALVASPAQQCEALCSFLGLSYDDAMLRFHEGRTKKAAGLSAKKAWLPLTPGMRDWGSQMRDEDVERFEAAAGDLLDELGYSRRFPSLPADALRHAARMRHSFEQELSSMGRRQPQRC